MTQGKKPASAMPRMVRAAASCGTLCTNPVRTATAPQLNRIRAIQRRAPTLRMSMLLGTSNRKYPIENSPAIRPNSVELIPEVVVHLQGRVADVGPVDEGDHVEQREERQDA